MKMELREKALDKLYKRRNRIEIPEYQRSEVWPKAKKQKFIDTIFKGWHVPKLYFRKIDDETFECVDGQQRLNAVFDFYENKLPLLEEQAKLYKGKYYEDLPASVTDCFDDFLLQIEEIEADAEEEIDAEIEELFKRLQLGVPLNAPEKLNAIGGGLRDFLKELSKHTFLKNKLATKDTRYTYLDICSKVAHLVIYGAHHNMRYEELEKMYQDNRDFSSNTAIAKKLLAIFDFLDRAFPKKEDVLRNRATLISVCHIIFELSEARSLKGLESKFKKFVEEFSENLRMKSKKGLGQPTRTFSITKQLSATVLQTESL